MIFTASFLKFVAIVPGHVKMNKLNYKIREIPSKMIFSMKTNLETLENS
jgi:hypothetical protein